MMKADLYPEFPILLVDDEPYILESCGFLLNSRGVNNVKFLDDGLKLSKVLSDGEFGAIILDLMMPKISGLKLLQYVKENHSEIPVIILTAVNDVDIAVKCMRYGAFDYILKPIDGDRFMTTVKRALEFCDLQKENSSLKRLLLNDALENHEVFEEIITGSKLMRSIFQYVESISKTSFPILVTGETGVGKELIAKTIHNSSSRNNGPFVTVNVAGLDDNLFTDTLFGHVAGAYSGAEKARKGLVETAACGTLFLDEIGDLSETSQLKLLRLLQEREYYPLGSDAPKLSNARIVVATNKDSDSLKKDGAFRKDLFYRLQAHQIHIPPLRERKEDIPLLVDHFLESSSEELNKKKPTIPVELYTLLASYHFPGNIRELKGMIFDAVSRHKDKLMSLKAIKEKIAANRREPHDIAACETHLPAETLPSGIRAASGVFPTLKEVERLLIEEALKQTNNNQTIAADLLGISRAALNKRLTRSSSKPEK